MKHLRYFRAVKLYNRPSCQSFGKIHLVLINQLNTKLVILLVSKNGGVCILASSDEIEKISVFRVTGLKILGRVGTHIFFFFFFFWKKYYLMHYQNA